MEWVDVSVRDFLYKSYRTLLFTSFENIENSPIEIGTALTMTTRNIRQGQCEHVPIVNVSSPFSWRESWVIALRATTKQLLDPFILFKCCFKTRSISEPPTRRMICEKVYAVVDGIKFSRIGVRNHREYYIAEVDWRIRWSSRMNHDLVSVVFSLWFHVVNDNVESWWKWYG